MQGGNNTIIAFKLICTGVVFIVFKRLPGRKRTLFGEPIQQDIDTRFQQHEADKFATAPRLRAEGKTVSDRHSVAQTEKRAGERTCVETPRDVRRVAVVPAS